MTCSTNGAEVLPAIADASTAYGRTFWSAYIANALTMIAISILVRYADFVRLLGGSEGQLGLIVGVGMVGSLVMRLAQGVGIDRHGARQIWLWSLVGYIVSLLAHLAIGSAHGVAIYLVRIAMQTSIAGIFSASITYISRRAPPERMAEMIGTLGTSGFIGILLGPQIADWICQGEAPGRDQLNLMFVVPACLAGAAFVAAWTATGDTAPPAPRRRPPWWRLVRRYHPGIILLVATAVGAGVTVPNTFLRPFAAEQGIAAVGMFFGVYAVTAFAARMATRNMFERFGTRPWVYAGLFALATSYLLYLPVRAAWQLVIPGAVGGVAHAFLFPAVVAGGSTRFPERYRGLGTTLMLAFFDLGSLLGAPLIGAVLEGTRSLNRPWLAPYPTTFVLVSAAMLLVAALFYLVPSREHRPAARVLVRLTAQQRPPDRTDAAPPVAVASRAGPVSPREQDSPHSSTCYPETS